MMGIFVVILNFYDDLDSKYAVNNYYEEDFISIESAYESVENQTRDVNTAIQRLTSGNLADIFGGLLQGTLGILKLFLDSFVAIGTIFGQAIAILGLGSVSGLWVGIAALGVLMTFLMFIIAKVR
jgi:hypothetical protein